MEEKGFFEKRGAIIDESIKNITDKLNYAIGKDNSDGAKVVEFGELVRKIMSHVGKDVGVSPIDDTFEYNDIISWVSQNAVGNKFYIVKGNLENGNKILLVFFGRDEAVLYSEKYPKICYVYNRLNDSISDLFATGNTVFVKSFKIR